MYTQIAANKRKTVILMAGFVLFVWAVGWIYGQAAGSPGVMWFMLAFALIYAIISYFASAKLALALSGAKAVTKKEAPQLYRLVENLAITAGLPTPKVYVISDPAPNAFAAGRDPQHAVVAVTTGLVEKLEDEELEGVIAHEMAHIGNYDIRLMAIVVMLVSVIAMLSDFFMRMMWWGGGDDDDGPSSPIFLVLGIVAAILAPIVALIIQLAVSRNREFLADATGAMLTRYPDGLARALEKIEISSTPLKKAHASTAHLFIANPLKRAGVGRGLAKLFSTHPPIKERVARLRSMGGGP